MILAALALAAAEPESPRAYIARIYTAYHDSAFNPLDHPGRYFAPRLRAAIDEDARLAGSEVGYLDGDPICQCQDPAGLHATIRRVAKSGTGRATISALLVFAGRESRPVTFSLVETAAGWRIADVSSAHEPSLLAAIERSNRAIRAKR